MTKETNRALSVLQAEEKRVSALVIAAAKASNESVVAIQSGFAAAMIFALQHGECKFLNELYVTMDNKDSYAMRGLAIPRMLDVFGTDGIRKLDSEGKETERWIKRPTDIIRFRTNPAKDNPNEFFSLIPLNGDKVTLSGDALKGAKANKAAILKAGEKALAAMPWVTPAGRDALQGPYTMADAEKGMYQLLSKWAKNGRTIGKTKQEIVSIGRLAGLNAEQLGKLESAWDSSEPAETVPVNKVNENKPDETPAEKKAA